MGYVASRGLRLLVGAMLCMGASLHAEAEEEQFPIITETSSAQVENEVQPEEDRYLPAGGIVSAESAKEYLEVQMQRACSCVDQKKCECEIENNDQLQDTVATEGSCCGERYKKKKQDYVENVVACLDHDNAPGEEGCKDCYKNQYNPFNLHDKAMVFFLRSGMPCYYGAVHTLLLPGLRAGDTIQLEDFSVWNISWGDTYKVMNWLPSDEIVVRASWLSSWYTIHNLTNDVQVSATLSKYLRPQFHTYANHRIIGMDIMNNWVLLENGTIWSVYFLDFLAFWEPGETIIIGINDDWATNAECPYILINAARSQYARAQLVN